jgi:hypothetical protein
VECLEILEQLQCPDDSSFDYRALCWVMGFIGESLGPFTADEHVINYSVICTVHTYWICHTVQFNSIQFNFI